MDEAEKRKNEILSKLGTIKNDPATTETYRLWIAQVEEYIKGEK